MSKKTVELVKAAMGLSYGERVRLVDELLATLEPEEKSEVDKAWAAEVEKREADIASGMVKPVIWDEVRTKASSTARGKD